MDSRSNDGEITFHDWHPVNIQEYGIAAADPRDPDLVFGSMRTNVSLYDRRTGQTTTLGPSAEERGTAFSRNVRTMPINWSPVDPSVLFYTSNAVWKSTDHAHTWTRISPDLARQSWTVPASAGKYAATVTPAPLGIITALSPSPRDLRVLWAGTDDGNIQVTTDGGPNGSSATLVYATEHGYDVIEVTAEAEERWTRMVDKGAAVTTFGTLGQYVGSNIPGKPRRYLLNTGGRLKLFEIRADVVANDYQAFEMSKAAERAGEPA